MYLFTINVKYPFFIAFIFVIPTGLKKRKIAGRIEPAREGKENRKPASPKVKNEQKNDQKKKKPEKKSNSVRQPGTLEEAIRKVRE